MGIFRNLMGTKEIPIKSNDDFWNWFQTKADDFFKIIKNNGNIERDFFNHLLSKLNQLRDGYFFLAGMLDDNTAELIITADGNLKNIVFVEELVQSAPKMTKWKFTPLKPSMNINDISIRMGNLKFYKGNLSFYSNDNPEYPDEIDITVVYTDYKEDLKEKITAGIYLFIEHYLGELNSMTTIDNMEIIGNDQAEKELIPIEKLKDFLIWRQKEFIEKYEGKRYHTENDSYNSLQATLDNGKPLIAIINADLLDWDCKASHPWIITIEIKYKGDENGMPDQDTYELMNILEEELMLSLKDSEGYLNIGRQTAESCREIYFACKDFRLPSKIITTIQFDYQNKLIVDYSIYKDKYWQSLNRFKPSIL